MPHWQNDYRREPLRDFARSEFTWPTGIALSKDGNVYVSDEWENKIAWLPPDRIMPFPEFDPWGERGSKPGQIDGPAGIVFDDNNDLYVVDGRNDRVQKFTKDGEFLQSWGTTGSGDGQFNNHVGVSPSTVRVFCISPIGATAVYKSSHLMVSSS